jgi:hypothetical protein
MAVLQALVVVNLSSNPLPMLIFEFKNKIKIATRCIRTIHFPIPKEKEKNSHIIFFKSLNIFVVAFAIWILRPSNANYGYTKNIPIYILIYSVYAWKKNLSYYVFILCSMHNLKLFNIMEPIQINC